MKITRITNHVEATISLPSDAIGFTLIRDDGILATATRHDKEGRRLRPNAQTKKMLRQYAKSREK